MTPRKAAYYAVLNTLNESSFIKETLADWKAKNNPSIRDFNLAQEIAYGSVRMTRSLETVAKRLTSKGKLTLKRKEKALLYTALYQVIYLSRIPLYAITEESVAIAKTLGMHHFAKFLNALLRKLENGTPDISDASLGKRLSYPDSFVTKVLKRYGDQAEGALLAMNSPSKVTARRMDNSFEMIEVDDLTAISEDNSYYIQNSTPINLVRSLAEKTPAPSTILDLCAAPGGKSLAAMTLFPDAKLTANDVSEMKIKRLKENFSKYGLDPQVTNFPAEEYPLDEKFDLIIIDAPCSNSGVLHKKPEARLRIDEAHLKELKELQGKIIDRALKLLNKGGSIWYMTCSILPEENEEITQKKSKWSRVILPTGETVDGGFAALIE